MHAKKKDSYTVIYTFVVFCLFVFCYLKSIFLQYYINTVLSLEDPRNVASAGCVLQSNTQLALNAER